MIAEALRHLAVPCDSIDYDPANARLHNDDNLSSIRGSLRSYGQRKPIVVNKRTGTVEAGNGTLQAARQLGWTHIAAVFVDDDPNTAAGFSLSDNRTAELAEWDDEALAALLPQLKAGNDELEKMLADFAEARGIGQHDEAEAPADPGAQVDRAAELQQKWNTQTGQLWVIPSKTAPPRRVVKCPCCGEDTEV